MRHILINVIISLLLCVGTMSNSKSQVKTKIFNEGIPDKFIPIHKLIIPEKVIIEPTQFTGLLNQTQLKTENLKEYSNRFAVPAEVDLDVLANAKVTEEKGITTFALTIHA